MIQIFFLHIMPTPRLNNFYNKEEFSCLSHCQPQGETIFVVDILSRLA